MTSGTAVLERACGQRFFDQVADCLLVPLLAAERGTPDVGRV